MSLDTDVEREQRRITEKAGNEPRYNLFSAQFFEEVKYVDTNLSNIKLQIPVGLEIRRVTSSVYGMDSGTSDGTSGVDSFGNECDGS